MTQNITSQDDPTEHADVLVPGPATSPEQADRGRTADVPAPRRAAPEAWIPSQGGSPEHSGPIPRPFALGATTVDDLVEARPTAPEPTKRTTPDRPRTRRGFLGAGAVLGIVVLAAGVIAVAVTGNPAHDAPAAGEQAPPVHQVTYQVTTEHGTPVTVDYTRFDNAGFGTGSASSAGSPWSVDTQTNDYYSPTITASLASGPDGSTLSDAVTCTIVRDGVMIARNVASGPDASVSCFGS